jgi:copper ion binding protein
MVVEAPYRTCVTVTGLTCQHCVMSVTEEVADIDGVSAVDVRLDTGQLTVLADRDVERGEIEAAVLEAGFELAG